MIETGMGVGLILMLFWTPGLLAKGVNKMYSGDVLTFGEKFLCFVPIVNTIRAEVQFCGKIAFHTISSILMILTTVFRVFVYMTMFEDKTMTVISVYAFIIGFALFIISHMYLVFNVMYNSDNTSLAKPIIFALLFPFGQYYVGTFLGNVVNHNQKKIAQFEAEYEDEYDEYDEEYDDY